MQLPAPILSTSAPSREYRRHLEVEAPRIDERQFRTGWRIKTHLSALAEAGRIGGAELAAGIAWRGWVESIGRVRVQAWVARIGRCPIPGAPGERQLAAASRLRAAALTLGEDRKRLLFSMLVDDLSWVELGARIGLSDKTTKDRCAEALSALASWLAGRRVPDPPRRWR